MLLLQAKHRHAAHAMFDVALHQHKGPVSLARIADRYAISQSYLEQVFLILREANLVQGVKGPGGGYLLKLKREEINLDQIIQAIEAVEMNKKRCREKNPTQAKQYLVIQSMLDQLKMHTAVFLQKITLQQLVDQAQAPSFSSNSME